MLCARLLRSEEDLKKVMCDLKSIPDGYFWQLLLEHFMEKKFFGLWTLARVASSMDIIATEPWPEVGVAIQDFSDWTPLSKFLNPPLRIASCFRPTRETTNARATCEVRWRPGCCWAVSIHVDFEEGVATPGVCFGLRPAAGTKYWRDCSLRFN